MAGVDTHMLNQKTEHFTSQFSNVFYEPQELMYADTTIGSGINREIREQKRLLFQMERQNLKAVRQQEKQTKEALV